MKVRGVTQQQMAEHLGITQGAVSRWFRGSIPSADLLYKAAKILGVSMESFFEQHQENTLRRNVAPPAAAEKARDVGLKLKRIRQEIEDLEKDL